MHILFSPLPIPSSLLLNQVHARWWWKSRLAAQGFEYSRDLSQEVRKVAMAGRSSPGSEDSQAIVFGMMVFINPAVASLPQHQHLFGGHGCYANKVKPL